jgi:hypothetical protein
MHLLDHEYLLLGVLGVCALSLLWGLIRRSHNPASHINLDDLLVGDDGKVSKAAAVMMGSFAVTSWVVVFQTINHSITDTTFGLYVASWVAPTVTRLIKGNQPGSSSTTTSTSTQTVAAP